MVMDEHPKAPWFRGRALEAIKLALSAKDPRIKRLHTAEAARWLRLAQLKTREQALPGSMLIAAE
jgi:hypothetical protein